MKKVVACILIFAVIGAVLTSCSNNSYNNNNIKSVNEVEHVATQKEDESTLKEEEQEVTMNQGEEAVLSITPYAAVKDAMPYEEIMKAEAEWISSMQLDSGIVPKFSGPNAEEKYDLTPYFTVIGLEGLLEMPGYEAVVKNYMDWHFAHLNRVETSTTPAGSIDDYVVAADKVTLTAKGDFDSTDSYASTFINLLRKYAEVTGDKDYLLEHKDDITLIGNAMLSTLEADGLTWAKPSYKVKYLMDNAEVQWGLVDLEWISNEVFQDAEAAAEYHRLKEVVSNAIEKELWDESRQAYAYAKGEDGALLFPNWSVFYPDATAQLFPILTGLIEPDSERAIQLYNKFNSFHRGWPILNKPDGFPWAILAYTAVLMGDKERADHFLASIKSKFIDQGHPWPWYVMESGLTIWAASLARKL